MGGKLIFTGGIYNLRSLNSGDNTQLVFRAASQVRIAEKFETGQGSSIGPETGAAIQARGIVFYVAGINGANGNLGATPKAAKVGLSNTVFANFYVPNGTLWLRQGSVVEGAFIGKDVDVGIGVKVSLNSAW
jgi:ribosomal protein S12